MNLRDCLFKALPGDPCYNFMFTCKYFCDFCSIQAKVLELYVITLKNFLGFEIIEIVMFH